MSQNREFNDRDMDEGSFLRHWSERVWDRGQLAQMAAIEEQLTDYAMNGWRPMTMLPPADTLIIGACEEGLVFLSQNQMGDWRTASGMPHRKPYAWMPAPRLPQDNTPKITTL